MKLLGLNSPELFIILVILLSILGPKRIEKGFLLFKKLLKFLLSKDEDISLANSKVKLDKLEEKNKELVEKINYPEETIPEINEQKLLTEDKPTLPGDPSTNNSSDPLTPLDQKFITLEQFQNHYRTFINRIQQQIATIGGGGAGVMHDLDDVTFDRTTGQGKLLIYNGSKWVGIASTAVGGGAASELAENATGVNLTLSGNLNVTGDITYDEATARNWNVSGIATVGTAFYMPQYTTTARDAATFNEGAMIYNTTTKKMEFYDGTSWTSLPGMSLGLTVALDG